MPVPAPTPDDAPTDDDAPAPVRPDTAAVVLAAGQGTRLRSDTAKVLHRAAGRSLLAHVLAALRPLGLGQVVVVVGHQRDEVADEASRAALPNLTTVVQERQEGTGHATQVALEALGDAVERVLVVPGDAPLITPEVLTGLLERAGDGAALLTTTLEDPAGYGRVLTDERGTVDRIVEHADATAEQRAVRRVNAGMYAFARAPLAMALDDLPTDNVQGERYLTDVVARLDRPVAADPAPAAAVRGVNDRAQLADAAARLRRRHLEHLMVDVGVTVVDPAATWVDVQVRVGRDTVIEPGCHLRGDTRIGDGVRLGPDADLTDTVVEDGAVVRHAVCEGAVVGPGVHVGPYTHLRPGTRLREGSAVGSFAEVKQSTIGEDAKVPHLAYVGDAEIGARVNVSCGVVTVNYDGFDKHRTVVGDDAFLGCDTMLVAPLQIGTGAWTAAGSTVTEDVPADALAIARARQTIKPGWAGRRRAAAHEDHPAE